MRLNLTIYFLWDISVLMLTKISTGLWTQVEPLSMIGIQFGNRTTVIALDHNKLILHSPGKLTAELKKDLERLGEVAYILAPNYYHSLFLEDYVSMYPDIQIFMAPRLDKKRQHIPCSGILNNQAHPAWTSVLQQCLIEGMPSLNEVVFFHEPSRSLIVTDLVDNMLHPKGIMTHIHFFIHGAHRRFAFSRIIKMFVRDKILFGKSLKTVMHWDFDRILMSHGEIISSGGKAMMQDAFKVYI